MVYYNHKHYKEVYPRVLDCILDEGHHPPDRAIKHTVRFQRHSCSVQRPIIVITVTKCPSTAVSLALTSMVFTLQGPGQPANTDWR